MDKPLAECSTAELRGMARETLTQAQYDALNAEIDRRVTEALDRSDLAAKAN